MAEGTDAISVILGNEAHSFPALFDGTVSNFTGSGTEIKVFQGAQALTYKTTPSADGEWKVIIADTANIVEGTLSGNNTTTASVSTHSGVSASTDVYSISYTITGSSLDGTQYSITKQQSLTKSKTGQTGSDGSAGIDSKTVKLSMVSQSFVYDTNGLNPSPATTTVTAEAFNTESTPYYRFYENDTLITAGAPYTSTTHTFTPKADYDDMPVKIEVELSEDSTGTPVLARDQMTAFGLKAGTDAITIQGDNLVHTLPMDSAGEINYTGSGTTFTVWKGATQLQGIASGTPTAGQYRVSSADYTNITPESSYGTVAGTSIVFGTHSAYIGTGTAAIGYTVQVESNDPTASYAVSQSFSLSIEGSSAVTCWLQQPQWVAASTASNGQVSDFTDSGNILYGYEGTDQLDYTTGTPAAGQFTALATGTNIATPQPTDGGNEGTIGNITAFSASTATGNIIYTITGKRLGGDAFTQSLTYPCVKAGQGTDGSHGVNAPYVELSINGGYGLAPIYDSSGVLHTAQANFAQITASAYGTTSGVNNGGYFEFIRTGSQLQASATDNTVNYPYTLNSGYAPEQLEVRYRHSAGGAILTTDHVTFYPLLSGSGAPTFFIDNPSAGVYRSQSGAYDYAQTQATISGYFGATPAIARPSSSQIYPGQYYPRAATATNIAIPSPILGTNLRFAPRGGSYYATGNIGTSGSAGAVNADWGLYRANTTIITSASIDVGVAWADVGEIGFDCNSAGWATTLSSTLGYGSGNLDDYLETVQQDGDYLVIMMNEENYASFTIVDTWSYPSDDSTDRDAILELSLISGLSKGQITTTMPQYIGFSRGAASTGSSNQIIYPDANLWTSPAVKTATRTMNIGYKDQTNPPVIQVGFTQSLTINEEGQPGTPGGSGTNARAVEISSSVGYAFAYQTDGTTPTPNQTTLTAIPHNLTGSGYYTWYKEGSSCPGNINNSNIYLCCRHCTFKYA